jgi:hypothetical protein
MPVDPLRELDLGNDFLSAVLTLLEGKPLADIGFDYHSWSMYPAPMPTPPDFHTQGEDYPRHGDLMAKVREAATAHGFGGDHIISGESGMAGTAEMERLQAGYMVRMNVYAMSLGHQMMCWTSILEYSHYADNIIFAHTGLINNPLNADPVSYKKLAYYTQKKMVEVLEGSAWRAMQMVADTDNVRVYRLAKGGRSIYVVWWDFFNDPSYVSGASKVVRLTGLRVGSVRVTEAIPSAENGSEISDYAAAFATQEREITDCGVELTLGDSPVFVEE